MQAGFLLLLLPPYHLCHCNCHCTGHSMYYCMHYYWYRALLLVVHASCRRDVGPGTVPLGRILQHAVHVPAW